VEFRARAAGAGVAHHPEVVLLVAVDDVDGGIEAGLAKEGCPKVPGFLVAGGGVAQGGIRLVDGGVEALGWEMPHIDDELPSPLDGFLFEIVAKGPVPKHFKKGVVIGVEPYVLQVVVFASGADAFLRVRCPRVQGGCCSGPAGNVGGLLAEEDRHKLVHARIGEEQVGGVRQEAGRGYEGVLLRVEEVEEGLADLGARHHGSAKR
jgi:hypothetical protein